MSWVLSIVANSISSIQLADGDSFNFIDYDGDGDFVRRGLIGVEAGRWDIGVIHCEVMVLIL